MREVIRRQRYHHGNLREALVEAALALVEERGSPEFTLREVARRVGVTHAAPQRHFEDRAALVAAVAEEGFHGLRAHVERMARLANARDPAARLHALGVAYVQFAVQNPAHFRVMFTAELADKSRHPSLQAASRAMHDFLVRCIEDGQREGFFVRGDPLELAFAAWSLVHGLAVLLVDGRGMGRRPADLIEPVVARLNTGLQPRERPRRRSKRSER
jgi:AcrR family transcriptional regulator